MPIFSKAHRLLDKTQFDAVYQRGRKSGDNFFLVITKNSDKDNPRLGLSVSARSVGNAVNRNRIKRIIRSSFQQHCGQLPAIDIVVNTRNAAREATNDELRKSLAQHWARVVKQCGVR